MKELKVTKFVFLYWNDTDRLIDRIQTTFINAMQKIWR